MKQTGFFNDQAEDENPDSDDDHSFDDEPTCYDNEFINDNDSD